MEEDKQDTHEIRYWRPRPNIEARDIREGKYAARHSRRKPVVGEVRRERGVYIRSGARLTGQTATPPLSSERKAGAANSPRKACRLPIWVCGSNPRRGTSVDGTTSQLDPVHLEALVVAAVTDYDKYLV